MVKTVMSSDNSEPEQLDVLTKAKEKLMIQQHLIDTSARTLQRLKDSTSRLVNNIANGESQSAIDDDIKLQENKLMKGFSNQLIEKHRYLKRCLEEYEDSQESVEKVKSELDELISLQQFLNITGLQATTTKVLLEEEHLTLDLLFSMLNSELEQLMTKYSIPVCECRKLLGALDHLTTYYEMWERGVKPPVTSLNRLSSTSSRLNSLSNLSSLDQDSRSDSISSSASAGTSPLPLHLHFNHHTSTPTPVTPPSSQSLLSPSSPFTTALANSTPLSSLNSTFAPSYAASPSPIVVPVLTPPPQARPSDYSRVEGSSSHGLIRSHSSSSNILLGESEPTPKHSLARSHHSVSSLSNTGHTSTTATPTSSTGTTGGGASGERRRKPPLTHKRSLSNPLANIVLNQHLDEESETPSTDHTLSSANVSRSSLACYSYRSPSPPSRSGSQPSMLSNAPPYQSYPHPPQSATVAPQGGSPIPQNRTTRHPQIRRISTITPTFSQSIPNDQLMSYPSSEANPSISGSESVLNNNHGNWNQGDVPRCNSMAGMSRPEYSQGGHNLDLTSSSMVDLPVGLYNGGSTEHLDQVEEGGYLPQSAKSQSVPRLTLMSVSNDSDRGFTSNSSNPTSPHTPGSYTPTRSMRHTIMHRFTTKAFITPHICDFCKKTVMIGVRCKDCKSKYHKSCAAKAPPSCGLPPELMDYFRKHVSITSSLERLADQRVDHLIQSPSTPRSPSERSTPRPVMERSLTYDLDTRERDFVIHDLASEPTNTHFSPILSRSELNGHAHRHDLSSQSSSASLLEVPHSHHTHHYRSTSSSPSITPPSSPSLTPSSPRSPLHGSYRYNYSPQREVQRVFIKGGGDSGGEDDYYSESSYSSECSSNNDVSDQSRVMAETPRGLRPGPQIILAKSLPDLLMLSPTEPSNLDESCSKFLEQPVDREDVLASTGGMGLTMKPPPARRVSMESHAGHHIRRKESLQRTLSAADSKASTLVASVPTEEDDGDSDSYVGSQDLDADYKPARGLHRNSVVDEWNIPFEHLKLNEIIGKGRVSEVHRGYWHGEVAIKRFFKPNANRIQVMKFKEEVSILKKTRHENLTLFMGASLHPPNLAIITMLCRGPSIYKCIHTWSESFHLEKSIDLAKQIAQAMGYLHARKIIHKNLSTRNVFLENDRNKVVISDTGFSNLSDHFWIDNHNNLVIRRTKLYYLAPELMRTLTHFPESDDATPYESFHHTEHTDIYAFGTVLYEMMVRKFPFSFDQYGFSVPPTAVIYLIGSGCRPEMHMYSREVPKRMQDLIYDCWQAHPTSRMPFKTIQEALGKMSRKKTPITRSPSFPISLSKSTEGLNFLKA